MDKLPKQSFRFKVEDFTLGSHLKTVYEFGTHYYLSRMENVRSVMLDTKDDEPLWGEVYMSEMWIMMLK